MATVPRLIHLNGLPGVGKSSLARRFTEEHRLALNLDVDSLRRALGQWQQSPTDSGLQARSLAVAIADAHLRAGFDVIVPQFVARSEFIVDLERVATGTGAEFIEVWVQAPLSIVQHRFQLRTEEAVDLQHVEAAQMLGSQDSGVALDAMNRDLELFLRDRSGLIVVDTGQLSTDQSYQRLEQSLPNAWSTRTMRDEETAATMETSLETMRSGTIVCDATDRALQAEAEVGFDAVTLIRRTSDSDLPVLSDGVVLLRPFAPADAAALVRIWADPTIRARNTVPEPTEDAALQWIAGRAASGDAWEWALVDVATERLAGRRALKGINWDHGRASAACWVAPEFRGRQFAARSLRLAAAHAFAAGLVRIEAECEADNVASLHSVRSAGMRHEGTLRSFFVSNAGVQVDAEMFGMLAEDLATAPAFRSP